MNINLHWYSNHYSEAVRYYCMSKVTLFKVGIETVGLKKQHCNIGLRVQIQRILGCAVKVEQATHIPHPDQDTLCFCFIT